MFTFSEAIWILVYCKTQEEIDKLWEALSRRRRRSLVDGFWPKYKWLNLASPGKAWTS